MKTKLFAILTILILTTTTATAINASIDQQTPIELEPEETIDIQFQLESTEDEEVTNIHMSDTEIMSDEIEVGPAGFQNEIEETPGQIELRFEAPSQETYENVSIEFTGLRNGTDVSGTVEDIEFHVEEPISEIFSDWVNEEQHFQAGEQEYEITDIENSLFLEDSDEQTYQIAEDELLPLDNEEYIEVHQTISNGVLGTQYSVAEITVYSEDQETNFEISDINEVQECELDLELRTGSELNRGQQNIFSTVDKESGESIPEVEVIITQQDGGEVVDTFITDSFGRHTYTMPEQVESDSLIFTFEYLGGENEFEDCDPNERVIEFDQTYADWLEGEESFQLNMDMNSSMMDEESGNLYGNLTGEVTNNEGEEVQNPVLEYEGPEDGETQISGSQFNYQLPETGEYEVRLSKSGYLESEWQTINYQDQCPQIDGNVEAEGCEEQLLFLSFYDSDDEPVNEDELQPNEQYVIEAQNEEGSPAEDFNEEMNILDADGETAGQIEFDQGIGMASFEGQGRLEFEGNNRFEPVQTSLTAESGISTMWLRAAGVIGLILILLFLAIIALGAKGQSSGRNAPTNMGKSGAVSNSDTKMRLSGSKGDE